MFVLVWLCVGAACRPLLSIASRWPAPLVSDGCLLLVGIIYGTATLCQFWLFKRIAMCTVLPKRLASDARGRGGPEVRGVLSILVSLLLSKYDELAAGASALHLHASRHMALADLLVPVA